MLLSFNQWSFSTIAVFHVLGSDSNKAQQEMSRQSQHFCDVFECWDLTNLWTHFARRLLPVVDTSCSLLQRRAGFHPKKTAGPLCLMLLHVFGAFHISTERLNMSTCQCTSRSFPDCLQWYVTSASGNILQSAAGGTWQNDWGTLASSSWFHFLH